MFCAYLKPTPNKIHISDCSTFMQEEIHPDGSHRKDGPSTRLRTFDTRLRNYIFTLVMAVSDGCKKWLYKVLHFRDKPMWDLGVTIHSPWNAWSWDVEVEDRDVSPAKRGMGWLRSKCRSIGSKEQSSLCLCLKPPKLRFIQPCIISCFICMGLLRVTYQSEDLPGWDGWNRMISIHFRSKLPTFPAGVDLETGILKYLRSVTLDS